MKVTQTAIPGLLLLEPRVFGDARGQFFESWNQARYAEAGVPETFVQDNVSVSQRGVLRGLHFQWPHPQGKLVQVIAGEVFDVAVDLRDGSPTFGKWVGEVLSSGNRRQLYVPVGFAHGFQVLSDEAVFSYKCTDYYRPEAECTVAWNDPSLGITWPIDPPTLSDKDQRGVPVSAIPAERQPRYHLDAALSAK